jgi:hypothetical protein
MTGSDVRMTNIGLTDCGIRVIVTGCDIRMTGCGTRLTGCYTKLTGYGI